MFENFFYLALFSSEFCNNCQENKTKQKKKIFQYLRSFKLHLNFDGTLTHSLRLVRLQDPFDKKGKP